VNFGSVFVIYAIEDRHTDKRTEIHIAHRNTLQATGAKQEFGSKRKKKLECGPMPNLMVALPNMGGALCSAPQSLTDAHY